MEKYSQIIDEIAEKGWSVSDEIFSESLVRELQTELKQIQESGQLKKAGIGNRSNKMINSEIRGDDILWFDELNLLPGQKKYWELLTELRLTINREFFLGLTEIECHFASYPIGSFYKRHLDQFKNSGSRLITCILYLNNDWKAEDSGFLRLYLDNEERDIFPEAGRFVCFKSEEIEHEVFPTNRVRLSITGWMRK